ncbi:Coenzyme F420 hydrogenase/dehydrogenase, beta subunit C-terminal domain [Occultella kanbiaonis]|uniref:Coenzyme F420 hydrogenase/dehydrogenase, beta subunit C-terminal domain n=1 Tax=Occultella kanbiaonis TaxID=2675754 RepID=UPI0012B7DE53|nr:Coenzyme F420 hydrogenase/dehydrogenase, beta subunit C-terminal domain [Occultella kanbiaonis]
MSREPLTTIDSIVDAHLCTGCGVCAFLRPDALRMADVPEAGRRPLPIVGITGGAVAGPAVDVCPGRRLEHRAGELDGAPFGGEWGPVLGLYECWSTDPDVRHRGSSGGVVVTLAAHSVTSGVTVGALQVQASSEDPLTNEVVLNKTYSDIVGAAGSRYSPASPGQRLDLVEAADGRCVVVGKPCDIAGIRAAAEVRPSLERNLGLTIAIFCAGTPSTEGVKETIRGMAVDPEEVTSLNFRGEGWPGRFRVRTRSGQEASLSYDESWGGTLHKHRQWRCMICPDHTGEFADLSVGDPWYRKPTNGDLGRSLVVVRTERGRQALEAAISDGALAGGPLPLQRLRDSQPNLENSRGAVWARVRTLWVAGIAVPRYRRMPAARLWWKLSIRQKASSIGGTLRRIGVRRLREPEFTREELSR